ncbi:hypothetical protein C9374_000528 [Naegleria lovaniensis]|uniref:Protein kinase domain-containing protein n=1 Tax=Naegleria lovaniensis TaxID=51637 RepID=A0AA88GYI8_NAELO|nr:uncharacterized protein C9374_000528 [Naegleria lovaniensis]KAG2388364.1 hypothetical protein C9374_000528 [Naegleria lovaniensis]
MFTVLMIMYGLAIPVVTTSSPSRHHQNIHSTSQHFSFSKTSSMNPHRVVVPTKVPHSRFHNFILSPNHFIKNLSIPFQQQEWLRPLRNVDASSMNERSAHGNTMSSSSSMEFNFQIHINTNSLNTNTSTCGDSPTNACPSLSIGLQKLNNNVETIVLPSLTAADSRRALVTTQFEMWSNDGNFCLAEFLPPVKSNVDHSMIFNGRANQVWCTNISSLDRSDILLLDFNSLFMHIPVISCRPLSVKITNCNLYHSVIAISQLVPEAKNMYCRNTTFNNDILQQASLTLNGVFLSNCAIFSSFVGSVYIYNVHQTMITPDSMISITDSNLLDVRHFKVIELGLFNVNNVQTVQFIAMSYESRRANFYLRSIENLLITQSLFNSNFFSDDYLLNLEDIQYSRITDCQVENLNHVWLGGYGLKTLELENLSVMNNSVTNIYLSYEIGLITIHEIDTFSIKNSKFESNSGYHAVDLTIHSYVNILIHNNTFRNSKSKRSGGSTYIGYFKSQYFLSGSQCNITFNTYEGNYCDDFGGAIYVKGPTNSLYLEHNIFLRNTARLSGGALTISGAIRSDISIAHSYFERNRVLTNPFLEGSLTNYMLPSGGGALYLANSKCNFLTGATFVDNEAARGGALYYQSFPTLGFDVTCKISECTFRNNKAFNSGGAIYLNNVKDAKSVIDENSLTFSNNRAELFGDDIATTTKSLSIIDFQPRQVYPGQNITIKVAPVDMFSRRIPIGTQMLRIFTSDQVTYELHSYDHDTLYISLKLLDTTFNTKQNITINPENINLFETITISITPCLKGFKYAEKAFNGQRVFVCEQDHSINVDLVIGIAVPLGILFLVGGIFIGIALIMCTSYIVQRIRILKQKELAEKHIEQKIIDKRIVFSLQDARSHDGENELLESNAMERPLLYGLYPEKQPSFIIPIENIEILKKIATGGFGIIYQGKLWNKVDVAIKLLKNDAEEMDEEFEKEVSLLSSLKHPNIVTFYGICITSDSKYMITEYLPRGSLDKALFKSKQGVEPLTFSKKISILIGAAKGIEYIHGLSPAVIHRDLKPGNILLDDNFESKICDFGISRTVAVTTMQSAITTNLGTLFYMAPEQLNGQMEDPKSHYYSKQDRVVLATKLDVYSFGIIMHEVFFEETPFVSGSCKLQPLFDQQQPESNIGTLSDHDTTRSASSHSTTTPLIATPFNVPQMVLKGARPIIPFRTEEQVNVWTREYMSFSSEFRNSTPSHDARAILDYFQLAESCWSEHPIQRPSFTEIRRKLESILERIQ